MQKPFWFTWKLPVVGAVASVGVGFQWPALGGALMLLSVVVFPLVWLIGGRKWEKAHPVPLSMGDGAVLATAPPMKATNAKLRSCKACGASISKTAVKCPQCGERNTGPIQAISAVVIAFAAVWFYFGGGIHQVVADDVIQQYELAVKGGNTIEICVKAKLVVEAFNQGHDEANYLKWQQVVHNVCPATLQ